MNVAQKKHVVLPKTPLPPHNGHLSTPVTFFCPQGGSYGEVRLYFRFFPTNFL